MALPEDIAILPPKSLLAEVEAFLDNHYVYRSLPKYKGFFGRFWARLDKTEADKRRELEEECRQRRKGTPEENVVLYSDPHSASLQWRPEVLEVPFSTALLELIESKGKNAIEVYKRAYIDRKLFSKIRNNEDYQPSKNTAIALALALELSIDETHTLLKRAGYTLSRSIMFDVIIEYFITHENFDIVEINKVLFSYDLPIFG